MLRWAESGWGEGEGVSEVGSERRGRQVHLHQRGTEAERLEERGRGGGVIGKREFSWVIEIKRVGHGGEREREKLIGKCRLNWISEIKREGDGGERER